MADPGWSLGYGSAAGVSASDPGPVYLGPTSPGVAMLLLAAAAVIVLLKVAGFRAMIAVGRS